MRPQGRCETRRSGGGTDAAVHSRLPELLPGAIGPGTGTGCHPPPRPDICAEVIAEPPRMAEIEMRLSTWRTRTNTVGVLPAVNASARKPGSTATRSPQCCCLLELK